MRQNLVFLDTETAASRGAPHLVELAAVRLSANGRREEFSSLVRAAVPIQPDAQAVHGIEQRELEGAPIPGELLARLEAWLGQGAAGMQACTLLAHNANFDGQVLGFEYARAGRPAPTAALHDTLKLARRAFPRASNHKLSTLALELGLPTSPRHRALADARTCAELYLACAAALGMRDPFDTAELALHAGKPTSIERCGPRQPRAKGLWARYLAPLQAAVRTRQEVLLQYRTADSVPQDEPVRLRVWPRLLYHTHAHAWLEALCQAAGHLKTYRLDRIAGLEPVATLP